MSQNSQTSFTTFTQEIDLRIYGDPLLKQKEILTSSLLQCKASTPTPCNKSLKPGDLSFECLECALDFECHLICESCFTKIPHQGHKFRYSSTKTGSCDCGNPSILRSHCSDHNILLLSSPSTLIKEYFPNKILCSIKETLKELFLAFFISCEREQKPQKSHFFLMKYLKGLLEMKSAAMDLLIGELFCEKLMKKGMTHVCSNILMLEFSKERSSLDCECEILELLFRFHFSYKDELFWKKTSQVIFLLEKYPSFKRELAICYGKMWNFVIFLPKYPNIFALKVSGFFQLYSSFFTKEIMEIWLKSHHFLNRLVEKTGDIIDSFFTSLNVSAYNAFDQIKSVFFFILKRECIASSFTDPHLLEAFIQVINKTHNPKSLIEEDNEKCRLHIECLLLMLFRNLLNLLLKNLDFSKANLLERFEGIIIKQLNFLKEIYQKSHSDQNTKEMKNKWPLHNTLQRSLVMILLSLLFNDNPFELSLSQLKESFHNLLKQVFEKPEVFFMKTIETLLISIKFSQEKVKPVPFYEMFENPFEGMKREVINGFYKKSYYLQNDYDQTMLQVLLLLSFDQKDFLKSFTMGFGIDLGQIFFKASEESYKKNLKDLLNNLIALGNDEVSLLNSCGFLNPLKRGAFFKNSLDFLIINAFQNSRIKNMSNVKAFLYNKVLSYDIPIESSIKELTFSLPTNGHTLRLKEPFENYYDPYIFYKYPKLANECYEGIKRLSIKNGKNDLIIGNEMTINNQENHIILQETSLDNFNNKEFSKTPIFLIRKALYSTELPRFLSLIFKIDAFTKEFSEILKSSIKLLYLNLQTLYNSPSLLSNDPLLINYRQYYQPQEFLQKLESLSKQKSLLEAQSSLYKLISLLNTLKETLSEQKKAPLSEKVPEKALEESFQSNKTPVKPSFQKKQDRLKKEFLEKQKAFLKKNLASFEELKIKPSIMEEGKNSGFPLEKSNISLEKTSEKPVCFYCHEVLGINTSSFGVYVYLTLDNFECRSEGRLRTFWKKIRKGKNSFSLSSCLHYVHKNCNEKMLKSNLKALIQKKILYTSVMESLCGGCKALNNLFVFFNEEKVDANRYSDLKSSHLDLEFTHNYIKDILNQLLLESKTKSPILEPFLASFLQDTQEFFDMALRVFLNYEDNDDLLKTGDVSILENFIEILRSCASNVSLSGLSLFLKRNRTIYRNIYLMFREYFWLFQAKTKEKYIEGLKKEANEIIIVLFETLERPDLEEIDQKSQRLLWIVALLLKNEDSTLFLMALHICKQVFNIFKCFYQVSCLFKLRKETIDLDWNDIIGLLQGDMRKNSDFKALLAGNLIQISRKLIGTLSVIFRFEESELKSFSPEAFSLDEEELCFYGKSFDFINLADLSEEENKSDYLKVFMQKTIVLMKDHGIKSDDMIEYYPMTYHILSLPRSFYELQQIFGLRKCEICGEFSRKGPLYLCLICGELLCSVDCKLEKKQKSIGNLNSHSKILHAGKGGFMNMRNSLIILMNYPRSISYGNLYKDSFGEYVHERTMKWENYELDGKMYGKIQDIMIGKKVPQEICYKLMENEEVILEIDYL